MHAELQQQHGAEENNQCEAEQAHAEASGQVPECADRRREKKSAQAARGADNPGGQLNIRGETLRGDLEDQPLPMPSMPIARNNAGTTTVSGGRLLMIIRQTETPTKSQSRSR